MSRPNIAIVILVPLLVGLFFAAVTSQDWVSQFAEPSLGMGMVVVLTFITAHIAITLGLAWATVTAAIEWRRNIASRTMLNGIVLAVGGIVTVLALGYAVFFL